MQKEFGLHPLAVEDAQRGHERPKIEEYGDSIFAVLHMIEPTDGQFQVGEVAIFAGPNYVLSIRSRAQKGFQEVRARCEREPELLRQGSGYVLYALMDAVVDRYFPILDRLEDELDAIEQHIFAPEGSPRANIEALYELKQRLMIMKHAVAPLLEGVSNLSGGRVPSMCAGMREYFRDVSDHLQRLNQASDSIRDTIATAISVNLAMITLQENETMKRLAAYAALVAVPTMIAGIYGMNFQHMPELSWRYGYELALLVMAALDGYLFYRLRKAKWL
jgi:magnesium transporter